ncbi:MAG: exo-alpha-sialidase [Caldilineaceae bacterium]|nr:exo-alpha-sialidase [Caldilineaceae bacterium]
MLEKTNLFEARTGEYWNYRVPGILCTARGVILATVEARRGKGGDWDGNDILLRRSLDGGVTWEPSQRVVSHTAYGPGPISNFVMIADRQAGTDQGTVHALYCHAYSRCFYLHSEDDGATFSDPIEITESMAAFRARYPWRVIAFGPGHGIQLENGRLVVPVWMSDGSGTEFGAGKLGHRPSEVACVYSDDHGQSWRCGDTLVRTDERFRNPSETIPVQLSNGRVLFNIRTENKENRRLISISDDGAHGWSDPRFDEALLEPVCMASIIKLDAKSPQNANYILFANPDNLENELVPLGGNLAHDRKRLTVKLSPDDCQSWPVSRVLEPGPSGYSDLATTPDGTILCIYENGMVERMTDTRYVTVARFDRAWVEGSA